MRSLGVIYVAVCSFGTDDASAFVAPRQHLPLRHHRFGKYDANAQNHLQDVVQVNQSLVEKVLEKSECVENSSQVEEIDTDRTLDYSSMITTRLSWKFEGHDIYCQKSTPSITLPRNANLPAILLVHGFGVSSFYWRQTTKALTNAGFTVYAMDLLGQGMSAKPSKNVTYSTNLWALQLDDFCRENLPSNNNKKVVLIGNSMGSIVSLIAATGDFANDDESIMKKENRDCYIKEHIAGIGMFNCGIGMNVHSITRDPKWSSFQKTLMNYNFDFMERVIFSNVRLMEWVLDKVVTKELLRNVLIQLYPAVKNPEEIVDDELVESIYLPAKDPESPKVLSQILTNDAGLTPMEVHAKYATFLDKLPIHVVWGDSDIVTPLDGIGEVAQFYTNLASLDGKNHVTMEVVHGGHVVFDEVPDIANGSMLRWLTDTVVVQQEKSSMYMEHLLEEIDHLRDALFGWLHPVPVATVPEETVVADSPSTLKP